MNADDQQVEVFDDQQVEVIVVDNEPVDVINLICISEEDNAERKALQIFFSETANDLQCVVCEVLPRPSQLGTHILTCPSDHIVCVRCQCNLTSVDCPKCRSPIEGGVKNGTLNNILLRVFEHACYECKFKNCDKKMKRSEVLEHELNCEHKLSLCPTCWKEFAIKDGPPCCPFRVAYFDEPENKWKYTVLLRDIYDSERGVFKNEFIPVNLFYLDFTEHVSRLFLCATVDPILNCLNISPVLLEDLEDSHFFPKARCYVLVVLCYVNVGSGPLKVGRCLKLNFQDKYRVPELPVSTLRLGILQVADFFQKSSQRACVECAEKEPHMHLETKFLNRE